MKNLRMVCILTKKVGFDNVLYSREWQISKIITGNHNLKEIPLWYSLIGQRFQTVSGCAHSRTLEKKCTRFLILLWFLWFLWFLMDFSDFSDFCLISLISLISAWFLWFLWFPLDFFDFSDFLLISLISLISQ